MEKLGKQTAERLITWIKSYEFKVCLEATKALNVRELLIASILGYNDSDCQSQYIPQMIEKWETKNSYYADKFNQWFENKEVYENFKKEKGTIDKQKYEKICKDINSLIKQKTMIENKHIQHWCHIIINDNDTMSHNIEQMQNNQSKHCCFFNFKWCCGN